MEQRKKALIGGVRESIKLETKHEGLDCESKKNNHRPPYSNHYVFNGLDHGVPWSLELPHCDAVKFSQHLCHS